MKFDHERIPERVESAEDVTNAGVLTDTSRKYVITSNHYPFWVHLHSRLQQPTHNSLYILWIGLTNAQC